MRYILLIVSLSVIALTFTSLKPQQPSPSEIYLQMVIDSSRQLYRNHDYTSIIKLLDSINPDTVGNDDLTMDYYYRKAVTLSHLDAFAEEFDAIVKGLQVAEKTQDKWMLASLYRELGSWHDQSIHDAENGLKYMKQALDYMDVFKPDSQIGLYMEIGLTSGYAQQNDSADYYFEKAFELVALDSVMYFDVCNFYIEYLLLNKRYEDAFPYVEYAYQHAKESGFQQGQLGLALAYADIYLSRGDVENARYYTNIGIEMAKELKSIRMLTTAYRINADIYKKAGTDQEQLESLNQYVILKDSLDKMDEQMNLAGQTIKFAIIDYEAKLNELNQNKTKLEKKSNTFLFGLVTASGLLLIGFSAFLFIRKKKAIEIKLLNEEIENVAKEREQLRLEHEAAINELEVKKRELTSSALFIEKKNETLKTLRKMLSKIADVDDNSTEKTLSSARKLAESSIGIEQNWLTFTYYFEQIHPSFYEDIKKKYPQLNQNDMRSLAYIKMGLTDKEIARISGISTASFQKAKYRLKKKLELNEDILLEDVLEMEN